MGKKKSIGGIVPLTPTDKELAQWNILFDSYLWMEPQKVKDGKEPGRVCYCTRCRKTYRVDEWARVFTAEERDVLTAKQGYHIKCAKCGVVCEARFVNVSRRKAHQSQYVAMIRANGHDEVLIDGYLLWKDYGEAKDGETLQFTALPKWRKVERYVLRPGEATKYVLHTSWSRENYHDDDVRSWVVDSWGDGILDMFLSYKGCTAQRYEPFTLLGEYHLDRTFLRYNALDIWNREAHSQKTVRYLALLCLYPGLEILLKAGYGDIAKAVVLDKIKFYGRIDLQATDPQSILGLSRGDCIKLRECKYDMRTVLKAHKHYYKDAEWSIGDIHALAKGNMHWRSLTDQLCFCNEHKTSPRTLNKYLDKQHELRIKQYHEAMRTNGCLARHGGIEPDRQSEWIHLRDWHRMYCSEMGVPPRELYPRDVSEAHDAVMQIRDERINQQIAAEREHRGITTEVELRAKREGWVEQTRLKYEEAAKVDGRADLCEKMDKRLRWRIKHLSFAEGNYMTVIPKRARELVAEGEALHHCVGTYVNRYASSSTNIVFLRDRRYLDQPLLTVEVDNEGGIKQCYGFNDDMMVTKRDAWMKPEKDKYRAVYSSEIRVFAEHYKAYLAEHFAEMKNQKHKKERTTA
jgi:hypothetical protein